MPTEQEFEAARREITSGVSASVLAELFGTSLEKVRERIGSVLPIGERRGAPLYRIRDVAPYLVRPAGLDLEEIVRGLKPAQLPTALQKDFWTAQINRQKFEAEAAQLWRTEKVRDALSDIFKVIRQRVMQFSDTVDRQAGLTAPQRRLLTELSDGLLEEMHTALVEHFKDFSAGNERDELYEQGPPKPPDVPFGFDDPNEGL